MRAPAVLCALAVGTAVAWLGHDGIARASDEPPTMPVGIFHNGALVDEEGVITLMTAGEPIALEIRSGYWQKDERGVPAFHGLADLAARLVYPPHSP